MLVVFLFPKSGSLFSANFAIKIIHLMMMFSALYLGFATFNQSTKGNRSSIFIQIALNCLSGVLLFFSISIMPDIYNRYFSFYMLLFCSISLSINYIYLRLLNFILVQNIILQFVSVFNFVISRFLFGFSLYFTYLSIISFVIRIIDLIF
jgi:hypothetical protein